MFDTNSHRCPNCQNLNEPRHRVVRATHMDLWYVCSSCRHSYRCTADEHGHNRKVTAESPHTAKDAPKVSEVSLALNVKSPCCQSLGRVRDTWRDERGYFRRHLCRSCGKGYFTCTDVNGNVLSYAKRPATLRKLLDVA
jgi:hypothetical protein